MPNYLDQEGLGYYDGKMKVYMSNAISSAVAATYKPGGSRTFEQLPSLVAEYVGFIYNITNDFTTTSDFVEGAGTFCKAGANVGIVNVGTNQSPVYKYDLFSAFVDLSNYATLDDLPTKTSDLTNDSGYASAFTGTTAQWNALTDAQKAKYELVCLTDDLGDSDNVKDMMVNKAQATVIARQDEAATASRSYVVGDFVYRDNVLYKVTAAISTGDSFVVGTNIATTTVETELSNKVDKVAGKGLSTNDYDDTEKGKVADNTGAIEAIVNENGCCNILPNTATTQEINGVTFTVNSDGSVTASGTASADAALLVATMNIPSGYNVKLKGCPSNGSLASYCIGYCDANGTWQGDNYDTGEGSLITHGVSYVIIQIASGYTIQGTLTFYPMLYDARLNPTGYVPYAMTNKELTERVLNPSHSNEVLLGTMSNTDNVIYVTATATGWITVLAPLSGNGDRTIKGYIVDMGDKFGTGLYSFVPNYNGGSVGCLPCFTGHSYRIVAYGQDSLGLEIYQYKLS